MSQGMAQLYTVIGAGVVGLTTALEIARRGHYVRVVAEHMPGEFHPDYTSPWAGAHWRSMAEPDETLQVELDRYTFKVLLEMALTKGEETGLMIVNSKDYYEFEPENWTVPWYHDLVPKFRVLEKHELLEGSKIGFSYDTVTVNPVIYLKWLQAQVIKHGGSFYRARLARWQDAIRAVPGPPAAAQIQHIVINCTGNGAGTLGGIEDSKCYPTRGQTVLVRCPGFNRTYTRLRTDGVDYVIPRNDGIVILGGTFQAYDDNVKPDPDTAEYIINTTTKVFPDLVNPETGKVDIVRHAVGLRPSRLGGVRIEAEIKEDQGSKILLIHNYGHGGQGYQSSWGSASRVLQLVDQYLPTLQTRSHL